MAQYFSDFSTYTAGVAPSDWTRRWVASPGTWTVIANAGFGGTKNGLQSSGLTAVRNAFAWNRIDSDPARADVEIVYRWTTDNATGNSDSRIMLRGSGGSGTENGYRVGLSNGLKRLEAQAAGTVTTPYTSSPTTYNITAGNWYWGRARANGTTFQFKHWADGTTEPAAWDFTVTDTVATGAGWVGLYQAVVNGKTTFDVFGVGTGGDSAPTSAVVSAPIVNAGPDQTVLVGSTVTLSATESDPNGGTLTGTWSQVSGPTVTLANTSNATTTFTAATGGRCTFRRTVSNATLSATSDTTVKVAVATNVRPDADIDNPGAFTLAGGATTIYGAFADESDNTYAQTPDNPTNKSCTVRLAPMTAPADTSGVKVNLRMRHSNATSGSVTVDLLQGTTVKKSWTQAITATMADYALALDSTSGASITDWTDLRVRVTATAA